MCPLKNQKWVGYFLNKSYKNGVGNLLYKMGQDFLDTQYPGTLQNAWSRSEGSPQSFRPAEAKADGATLNWTDI